MKKILYLSILLILIGCNKDETPQPINLKVVTQQSTQPINIDGYWYDYNHISGNNSLVPVKFSFHNDKYTYAEYNNTYGWMEKITQLSYFRVNDSLSLTPFHTQYSFFGAIINDSTIQITRYQGNDTLPSHLIHKEQ